MQDRVWMQRIEWGDGSSEERSAAEQSEPIAGEHVFRQARSYTIRMAVTDKDGGTGWATIDLVVERRNIQIVIKPGPELHHPERNHPNKAIILHEHGMLPVAVLGTPELDVRLVDPTTVRLGITPVRARRNHRYQYSYRDIDGDGDEDLMLHFEMEQLIENGDLTLDTTSLVLIADLTDGTQVQGVDEVTVVARGDKRRRHEETVRNP
jgi:hypothetical protein